MLLSDVLSQVYRTVSAADAGAMEGPGQRAWAVVQAQASTHKPKGHLENNYEQIDDSVVVQTPRELYESLKAQGYKITYACAPILCSSAARTPATRTLSNRCMRRLSPKGSMHKVVIIRRITVQKSVNH